MNRLLSLAVLAALMVAGCAAAATTADDNRVYELRIYTTHPGKLPDLLTRFREHTCRLFEKHGIENIGYWVPVEAEDGADNTLIYVLRHQSREAAKASFSAFGKDPAWQAARQASEVNGKILAKPPESIFLKPTGYSPPVQTGGGAGERIFEMRTYTAAPGKLANLHARFQNHTMGLFNKHGMTHIGYWTPLDADKGADTKLIYILAHPSKEAGLKAFEAFRADPAWIQAKAESERNGALTLPQPEGVKSLYMKAVDFSPIR